MTIQKYKSVDFLDPANSPKFLRKGIEFLNSQHNPMVLGIIPVKRYKQTDDKTGKVSYSKLPIGNPATNPSDIYHHGDATYKASAWSQASAFGVVTNSNTDPLLLTNLVVIDVDVPTVGGHTENGFNILQHLDINETMVVRTKSGGYHFIYQTDNPITPRINKYGLDIVQTSPFFFCGPDHENYNPIVVDWAELNRSRDVREYLDSCKVSDGFTDIHYMSQSLGNSIINLDLDTIVSEDSCVALDSLIEQINTMDMIDDGQRHERCHTFMYRLACDGVGIKTVKLAIHALMKKLDTSENASDTFDEIFKQYEDAAAKIPSPINLDWMLKNFVLYNRDIYVRGRTGKISKDMLKINYPQYHMVEVGEKKGSKQSCYCDEWLKHPDKKIAEDLQYNPGKSSVYSELTMEDGEYVERMILNTYRGKFKAGGKEYKPSAGGRYPKDIEVYNKLGSIVFGETFHSWNRWLIYKFRYPEIKARWGWMLSSEETEGTGKGMLTHDLCIAMFGAHNINSMTGTDSLFSDFNAELAEALMSFYDEISPLNPSAARTQNIMGKIKDRFTKLEVNINGKNKEVKKSLRVWDNIIMTSNFKNPLNFTDKSRRIIGHHALEEDFPDRALFKHFAAVIADDDRTRNLVDHLWHTIGFTIDKDFDPFIRAPVCKMISSYSKINNIGTAERKVVELFENPIGVYRYGFQTRTMLTHMVACTEPYAGITKVLDQLRLAKIIVPTKLKLTDTRAAKIKNSTPLYRYDKSVSTADFFNKIGSGQQDMYIIDNKNVDILSNLIYPGKHGVEYHSYKDFCDSFNGNQPDIIEAIRINITKMIEELNRHNGHNMQIDNNTKPLKSVDL